MNLPTPERVRWTTADLKLFPDNGNRFEIIDGEFVTKAPYWNHQKACVRTSTALDTWSQSTGLGEVVTAPGIIFSDADNVIPDVVWASNERLAIGSMSPLRPHPKSLSQAWATVYTQLPFTLFELDLAVRKC